MKNLYRSVLTLLLIAGTFTAKAQVPVMSSNPTATSVLFLDFDGHTVDNTAWNYAGPIFCGASGMTNANIISVFNRVAEDYRPFNLNVTTDSTKFLAAPIDSRMRVILTVTNDWYPGAGGVALIGTFSDGDDTPCFVFTSALGVNWVKAIAEAASHEAGHTLGLFHQSNYDANCNLVSQYHYGTGSGEIGWAPIMGVGYYKNFTLWNNGPNPYGCTSYQNDLTVITTGNGFTFRSDDHQSSFNQATIVSVSNNQFVASGIVTESTDQDMFRFSQTFNGRFVLNATPYNVGNGNEGSNLDLQVTLYNNARDVLNVFNPGTLLSSIIDTTLTEGNYYLRIEGRGNVNAPNYASLGSFSLQGNFFNSTLPLRRLELTGTLVNDRHKLNWLIDADEQVVEQVLEMSTNGRTFTAITQPMVSDRSYLYLPGISNAIQYRLKVTFDNGKTHYSNIVTLRNTANDDRPKLLTNLVNSTITVTSPGKYNYIIYDLSGKIAAKGFLVNGMNNITAASITGGMYIIRFTDETNQWTDKFVRQ